MKQSTNNLENQIINHFYLTSGTVANTLEERMAYQKGAEACYRFIEEKAWNYVAGDTKSLPELREDVLVACEDGSINVAHQSASRNWYISNGEKEYRLASKVVKWRELI